MARVTVMKDRSSAAPEPVRLAVGASLGDMIIVDNTAGVSTTRAVDDMSISGHCHVDFQILLGP